ncbi:RNA polymerase sigma factor [Ruania alba]|uniref:RNA polymerase sigma factor, sigma-70 family n=1 Tax=Ruania alba TaxID=648782 RepID=A0A1H5MVP4_9MICO|nr:sigma-70 family RNA polymerase sigma factor [Ruania alba]SEE93414.1 RNA polymerase sigma factor, sigma-70 family [Ruania alba]
MTTPEPGVVEATLRELAPQALAALVRHRGRFDMCEDAVQEAMIEADARWRARGVPEKPLGWLLTVASRRLTDQIRQEMSRHRRETVVATRVPDDEQVAPPADATTASDDALALLFMCCHAALTPTSRIALTLRAVGGLTTAQIARAFLVPEATMAQRISRAKQQIRAAGATFETPSAAVVRERLGAVLHVLYLIFNEGYVASSGPDLHRVELTEEAIRLTRQVRRLLPEDGEVAGLLALMLLTDARRPARTRADGSLVPLADQDRTLWDRSAIDEGVTLLSQYLPRTRTGPFQLQAAIAAVHAEAPTAEDTDWPQILAIYDVLSGFTSNPMVALNRAVAVAMVHGARTGLDLLDRLSDDRALAGHHRWHAVRAHLFELAGDLVHARASFTEAAKRATSLPEQRYLQEQVVRLTTHDDGT